MALAVVPGGWPAGALAREEAPVPAPPQVTAQPRTGPIRIDGLLDEPDWQRAGVIPDLVQQNPRSGEPTPYHTEVRLLIDSQNLYFGVRCSYPEDASVYSYNMRRDTDNWIVNDYIDLFIDTFGDRRSGFFFEVYPTGAQTDGLISGPGMGGLSVDWDGIWDSKTTQEAHGWTAEIRIPSRTLHFKAGLEYWNLEVGRQVTRERMWMVWSGSAIDAQYNDFARAGRLYGVGVLDQGTGLSVSPFTVGKFDRQVDGSDQRTVGQSGLDLAYSFTPQVTAFLTANTDFAETEVDARQVNITRFPLFFPEKRPFFLEGSNQYAFGLGLGTDFIPFYSRRVGLLEGEEIPIDGGVKILGHPGRLHLAALDIETGGTDLAPRTNLFAGRVTYDVTDRFRIGGVGTRGDPDGVSDNSLGGLDALWHTSSFLGGKNLTAGGWAARSGGDVGQGSRSGWGARIEYPNDRWNLYSGVNRFGEALEPALGFLPRPGTRQYQSGVAFRPRPEPAGPFSWARQFFYELEWGQTEGLDGTTQSRYVFTAPFNVETESGEHFEANWQPQFERLTQPFEIVPGVSIPPGSYDFNRYRLQTQSSPMRPWSIGSTVWFGDFYDGRLTQFDPYVNWSLRDGRIEQRLELINNFGHLPEGDFVQRLWQAKYAFGFSPHLVLTSFLQYDTDSRNLGMNTRLRWTPRAGNDVFVVWNRGWRHPTGEGAGALEPLADQIAVKIRLTFRM